MTENQDDILRAPSMVDQSSSVPFSQCRWQNQFGNQSFATPNVGFAHFTSRYPHPAHINAPFFVTVHLKSTNFLSWESQISNLIESHGCRGFIDASCPSPPLTIVVHPADSVEQVVPNLDFYAWKQTDGLIKGWIIAALSEDILSKVVGLKSAADVQYGLKLKFSKATMDRELTLYHQLETLRQESCDSLFDYLSKYKTACDELAAIGKRLPNDRRSFSMSNDLGSNYQMFTTMTLCPPLPEFSELLSMLHSYESQILLQNNTSSTSQVAFVANKNANGKAPAQSFRS